MAASSNLRASPADAGALDAYVKLMRAAESVTSRVHSVLPDELTLTQFGVLEALFHLGPLCPSVLAGKLLKSAGNLTLVVANLEKAGLVQRERPAHDRRYVTVALTANGRRMIAALFPKIAARIAEEFSTLSATEQTELGQLSKKLGLRLRPASAAAR